VLIACHGSDSNGGRGRRGHVYQYGLIVAVQPSSAVAAQAVAAVAVQAVAAAAVVAVEAMAAVLEAVAVTAVWRPWQWPLYWRPRRRLEWWQWWEWQCWPWRRWARHFQNGVRLSCSLEAVAVDYGLIVGKKSQVDCCVSLAAPSRAIHRISIDMVDCWQGRKISSRAVRISSTTASWGVSARCKHIQISWILLLTL
jgi:hypothetical protein